MTLKRSPSVLVMNKNALLPQAVCRFISLPLIQTKREGNRENKLARNLYDWKEESKLESYQWPWVHTDRRDEL